MTVDAPLATQKRLSTDSVTVRMNAGAEEIYNMIADVTRMGEWSPECRRCEWVGGATGPAVGARFKAWNKRGRLRWSNSPVVVVADPGRAFAFSRTARGAGEYVWRYRLVPGDDGGTDVTESYEEVRPENRLVSAFAALFTPGTEAAHLRNGMAATLGRIKATVEGT